ncbi:DEAD/DEAH box helicase family protein [Acinetobacter modestus]|uniref:DEAD/DEAH box helicase family protein n=1 Tax=Acinetobacter modestus TaxID=1776740 RepID=UPI00301A47FC
MERSEKQTCVELIEPALVKSGWEWKHEVRIGPNDDASRIYIDYLLTFRNISLAVIEAKAEFRGAAEGIRQASHYADMLFIRFSISTNGHDWILIDNTTSKFETLSSPPSPEELIKRAGWLIDWAQWGNVLSAPYLNDMPLRTQQEMAIEHTLMHFAQGNRRAQISMVTGSGRSRVAFQLVWKFLEQNTAQRRVLILTDSKILNLQMYEMFNAFPYSERQLIEYDLAKNDFSGYEKIYFSMVQRLSKDNKLTLFSLPPDFFDLIILSNTSDLLNEQTFNILKYFNNALQLRISNGMDIGEKDGIKLSYSERTNEYFGPPVFAYTLTQAMGDGYLVSDHIIQRLPDDTGKGYTSPQRNVPIAFSQGFNLRLHSRTREIIEDLWNLLGERKARDEKTVIFSSDITHASMIVNELKRLSGSSDYVTSLTTVQKNSAQIRNEFSKIGESYPRILVVVDMFVGLDVPDIQNIVFVRHINNIIHYRQMKGIGSRPCAQIGKTHLTIYDYSGATLLEESLQDKLFGKHPKESNTVNRLSRDFATITSRNPFWKLSSFGSITGNEVHMADGSSLSVAEYLDLAKIAILSVCHNDMDELYHLWINKEARISLRNQLQSQYVNIPVLTQYLHLSDSDEIDIIAKLGFQLTEIPTRAERVEQLLEKKNEWRQASGNIQQTDFMPQFWQAVLDHYSHRGVDELEQADTYNSPLFVELFGGFIEIVRQFGSAHAFRTELEGLKKQLYTLGAEDEYTVVGDE